MLSKSVYDFIKKQLNCFKCILNVLFLILTHCIMSLNVQFKILNIHLSQYVKQWEYLKILCEIVLPGLWFNDLSTKLRRYQVAIIKWPQRHADLSYVHEWVKLLYEGHTEWKHVLRYFYVGACLDTLVLSGLVFACEYILLILDEFVREAKHDAHRDDRFVEPPLFFLFEESGGV